MRHDTQMGVAACNHPRVAMAESGRRKRATGNQDQLSTAEHKRKKTVIKEDVFLEREDAGSRGREEREDAGSRGREESGGMCSEGVRCGLEFFDQPCVELARAMLGCVLVSCGEEGEECTGEVVEVEAYLGGDDRAAHSYNGRRTKANEAMYMAPGTAYVYSIYGVHHCFNVSSQGSGAAVLVRALRPMAGLETMWGRRGRREGKKDTDLCSGPGKICQALGITRQYDQVDMVTSCSLWLERGRSLIPELIIESPRVGIDSAGEQWAGALLRFYLANCRYVSKTRVRN